MLWADLQRFANKKWVADHLTPEQTARDVLDRFTRIVTDAGLSAWQHALCARLRANLHSTSVGGLPPVVSGWRRCDGMGIAISLGLQEMAVGGTKMNIRLKMCWVWLLLCPMVLIPCLRVEGQTYTCKIEQYPDEEFPNRSHWVVHEKKGTHLTIHIGNDKSYKRIYRQAHGTEPPFFREVPQRSWDGELRKAEEDCRKWRNQTPGASGEDDQPLELGQFRFKTVEWSPHQPLVIKAVVEERVGGAGREWAALSEPVYVSATLRRVDATNDGVPVRALTDAFDFDWAMKPGRFSDRPYLPSPSTDSIEFEGQRGFLAHNPRFQTVGNGVVRIDLGPAAFSGIGDYRITNSLNPEKLGLLWREMKKESRNVDEPGRVAGDVVLRAYRMDRSNYKYLATSKPFRIYLDRIAHVVAVDTVPSKSTHSYVARPHEGVAKQIAEFKTAIELDTDEFVRLIPDDKIELGRYDGVLIVNVIDGSLMEIQSNREEGRHTFYVSPSGARPPGWGRKAGHFLVGVGSSVCWALFTTGAGPVYIVGTSLGAGVMGATISTTADNWLFPKNVTWADLGPAGTVIGLDAAGRTMTVYLFEGKASVRGIRGDPVQVSQGRVVQVTQSGVSQPREWVRADLPKALIDAVEKIPRRIAADSRLGEESDSVVSPPPPRTQAHGSHARDRLPWLMDAMRKEQQQSTPRKIELGRRHPPPVVERVPNVAGSYRGETENERFEIKQEGQRISMKHAGKYGILIFDGEYQEKELIGKDGEKIVRQCFYGSSQFYEHFRKPTFGVSAFYPHPTLPATFVLENWESTETGYVSKSTIRLKKVAEEP